MKISAEEYQQMLKEEDLSPTWRSELEYRRRQAETREATEAKLSDQRRRELLTSKWQNESLRVLHQFLAKQWEVRAWGSRERRPLWLPDARNALELKKRGLQQRIARARREAAEGCREQSEWLALHAELVNAVEQPQANP